MTKIYSAPHALVLGNLRNALLVEGIESEIRTPFLGAARGDLPFTECWSELWALESSDPESPSWKCPGCGEEIEGQFTACWQCGAGSNGV